MAVDTAAWSALNQADQYSRGGQHMNLSMTIVQCFTALCEQIAASTDQIVNAINYRQ